MTADFLTGPASPAQLLDAFAANQTAWMQRMAGASGGESHTVEGASWIFTDNPYREVVLGVPDPARVDLDEVLGAALDLARERRGERIGVWTLGGPDDSALGVRLRALGFTTVERPMWMYVDLDALAPLPPDDPTLVFASPLDPAAWDIPELTCFDRRVSTMRQRLARQQQGLVFHLPAWYEGEPSAQASFNVTTGPLGVAGVYDVVIRPGRRRMGLGFERANAVFRLGRAIGVRYLVLSADDAEPLYRKMGIPGLGRGTVWWKHGPAVAATPDPDLVRLGLLLGHGDLDGFAEAAAADPGLVHRPLADGSTPIRFASAHGQERLVRWLLDAGAALDPIVARELGWHDELRRLLADPDVRDHQGPDGKTLLHVAVERADEELAAELLAAGADTTRRDAVHDGTPLQWAIAMRRLGLMVTLRRHERLARRVAGA